MPAVDVTRKAKGETHSLMKVYAKDVTFGHPKD